MYSSAYVWAKVLSHMEERLGAVTVSAWFDDAEVVELNEDNLILYSPSDFRREIIRRRCTDYIQDALKASRISLLTLYSSCVTYFSSTVQSSSPSTLYCNSIPRKFL